jgi:hypothetical protein
MTITRGDSTSPAKYLAFWVRARDTWRIQALKIGGRPIGGERSTRRYPDVLPGDGWTSEAPDSLAAVRTLAEAERAFARAGSGALGEAFSAFGDSLAGHLGQGAEFLFGREQIAADVRASAGDLRLTWGPDIVHVARSGDLGVSAGYIRVVGDSTLPPRPFFTIWRRASPRAPWRYIAE